LVNNVFQSFERRFKTFGLFVVVLHLHLFASFTSQKRVDDLFGVISFSSCSFVVGSFIQNLRTTKLHQSKTKPHESDRDL